MRFRGAALREFRDETLDASRVSLGRLLGVSEITILRWERPSSTGPQGLHLALLEALRSVGTEKAREVIATAQIDLHGALTKLFANDKAKGA